MLSQKARYALRALSRLARGQDDALVLIADIAEEERIPRKFLEAILVDLRRHGLLDSKRGKAGGYRLAREPSKITIGEVVRVLDGPLAPLPCASVTAYHPCDDCLDVATCSTRWVMRDVRDAISGVLDKRTLADLIGYQMAAGQLPLTYDI